MALQHHELIELHKSLRAEDKELLRILYRRDSDAPLDMRRATVGGVVKVGIYLTPDAAQRHLQVMERRGFLCKVPGATPIAWAPVLDEAVRNVVIGPKKEVSP